MTKITSIADWAEENGQIQEAKEHAEQVKRKHMDHIAEKRYVGSFHCGLVHKPVSFHEAMKIPEARAAFDKQWNK